MVFIWTFFVSELQDQSKKIPSRSSDDRIDTLRTSLFVDPRYMWERVGSTLHDFGRIFFAGDTTTHQQINFLTFEPP